MFKRIGSPVAIDPEIEENFNETHTVEVKCPQGHLVAYKSNTLMRLAKDKEVIFSSPNVLICEDCHTEFNV